MRRSWRGAVAPKQRRKKKCSANITGNLFSADEKMAKLIQPLLN